MVYLDTFYGCVKKLPNGNGEITVAQRTGDTLNRIVDDWLDAGTRSAIEATYGPMGQWDVSEVTNFRYLFYGSGTGNEKKKTFNIDISNWNVAAAVDMLGSKF